MNPDNLHNNNLNNVKFEQNETVWMEHYPPQNEDKFGKVRRCSKTTSGKNPESVARRNARERRRIKNVNSAFDELRLHVPNGEVNRKKISKVSCLC